MKFKDVVPTIISLSKDKALSFAERVKSIAHLLVGTSKTDVLDHLAKAHVIPECFGHDSTEEKLYAKYCDSLLAKSLEMIGLESEVITERANAADVVARSKSYRIVGDAKAFRLSRTAKNQKDFKVGALNSWRHGAEYACLVGPLYQYPTSNSQIYSQAIEYNVTLFSYTHLAFLIQHNVNDPEALKTIWEVGRQMKEGKKATNYWSAIADAVCAIAGRTCSDWEKSVQSLTESLPALAHEQIHFWEEEKIRIKSLSHDAAVKALIKALKIDSKIVTIRESTGILADKLE